MKQRHCVCHVLPPHMLEKLESHPNDTVARASRSTLLATEVFRGQRSIFAAMSAHTLTAGMLRRTVFDAHHRSGLPGSFVRGEDSNPSEDVAVNEAFDGAGATYAFYKEIFDRSSVDGAGMRLDSTVHYAEEPGEGYDNAFWNGRQMVYGDGDGVVFGRFTQALDVIAHELTHGVTDFTAGLVYHKQSGALNESMSDVFGSMVQQWKNGDTVQSATWLIGQQLFRGEGMALRSMKDPGSAYDDPDLGKDPQPGHMRDYVDAPDTRRGDWGGVHINSGIPNRAFYLACVNLDAEHSWDRAGRIWYHALTRRLEATSDFAAAKIATVGAAAELFGEAEAKAVEAAWMEVGV